mgnify:CR=1 FL=1
MSPRVLHAGPQGVWACSGVLAEVSQLDRRVSRLAEARCERPASSEGHLAPLGYASEHVGEGEVFERTVQVDPDAEQKTWIKERNGVSPEPATRMVEVESNVRGRPSLEEAVRLFFRLAINSASATLSPVLLVPLSGPNPRTQSRYGQCTITRKNPGSR